MSAKLLLKTVLIVLCAVGLVFILRRPDLYFTMELVSTAFYKNVAAILTVIPGVIAYYATKEFSKPRWDSGKIGPTSNAAIEKSSFDSSIYVRVIKYVSVLVIVSALISVFSEISHCDDMGNCTEPATVSEQEKMMNFVRITMAALVGMMAALFQRD